MTAVDLWLRDALLRDGRRVDVGIAAGRIVGLEPAVGGPQDGSSQGAAVDCGGRLLLPALVEAHVHLDKTLLGLPFVPHLPGDTVADRIAQEKSLRRTLTAAVFDRGMALVRQIAAFGTGHVRSHVDIDTEVGLAGLQELVRLRAAAAHLIDLQIVAFPQSGILRDPGVAELMDRALAQGADLVGGLDPAGIDGDIGGHLDVVFGLAERHGKGVDLHLHDGGELGLFELRAIAERTRALGMAGKVTVSHAFALGEGNALGDTVQALAEAGVAILTNGPGPVPMPPVRALAAAGVTVIAGSDNIRDAWSPLGNGDMLGTAARIAWRQGINDDPGLGLCLDMATDAAARVLGVDGYGIAPGARADLVLTSATCASEAVADHGPRALVIKAGRIVARDGALVGAP
jgi:cytosine/adenosine deaminase-related metal-dependent hydrolase